jgi:hypothetical protein
LPATSDLPFNTAAFLCCDVLCTQVNALQLLKSLEELCVDPDQQHLPLLLIITCEQPGMSGAHIDYTTVMH